MSVLKVGENKHFIIRINIISIKTLAFLINVTDKDPEQLKDKIHIYRCYLSQDVMR